MRVLLYVEPHPVRDTLTHFKDLAKEFMSLITSSSGFDVRLFANDATYSHLGEQLLAPHAKRLIRTTGGEEDVLNKHLKLPWTTEGLPVWLDLMAGRGEVTERQLDVLRRIWNIFPFEIIVHWGENGAVTRFLDERPVTRVAMELGCTRPPFFNSVVMDPFGTNGSAVVTKMTVDDLRGIVDNQTMSCHEALFSFSNDISAPGYSRQFQPLSSELDARWINKKIAFLPLQLFDDANLTRFSHYETLADVVLDVVPRLADAGYLTIIKPHPASKFRKGSMYENSFARRALRPWSGSIIWCEENTPAENARLFTLADVVVTVNSSVGFEALYYDKPVVVLGDAVYKPKDMFPTLDEVLSGSFDRKSYLNAAGILRRFMLGGYLQPESIRRDTSGFCSRLSLIHHLCQRGAVDPIHFATNFWRACAPAQTMLARSSMFWGISVPGRNEFGVPSTPVKQAGLPVNQWDHAAREVQCCLPMIRRLKSYWLTLKTREWLEERWATDVGRAEIITLGKMAASDYNLITQSDMKMAEADPVHHHAWAELIEGRSHRAEIKPMTVEEVFSQLKWSAEFSIGGDEIDALEPFDEMISKNHLFVFSQLVKHVSTLTVESFPEWLDSMWKEEVSRAKIIKIGEFVDADYYLQRYSDVMDAKIDPIYHFAWIGVMECRSPRVGIKLSSSEELLSHLKKAAKFIEEPFRLSVHPLPEEVERQRGVQVQILRERLAKSTNRIAVVAHLYYTDLVTKIVDRLRTVEEPFDLIVTMPDWGTRRTVELVRAAHPEAMFYEAPNRGRDIGPFIDLLPVLIEKNYDAVLKVQTKRGYFRADRMIRELGEIWRDDTFDALLGSAERVSAIVESFRTKRQLNMVGPQPFLLPLDKYPYHDGGTLAECIIGDACPKDGQFFAGTMFWVRPSCLQPLADLNLTHFASETGANDGALAHLIERMFGHVACAGALASAPVDSQKALDFEPKFSAITMDAYLAKRQKEYLNANGAAKAGALIW